MLSTARLVVPESAVNRIVVVPVDGPVSTSDACDDFEVVSLDDVEAMAGAGSNGTVGPKMLDPVVLVSPVKRMTAEYDRP